MLIINNIIRGNNMADEVRFGGFDVPMPDVQRDDVNPAPEPQARNIENIVMRGGIFGGPVHRGGPQRPGRRRRFRAGGFDLIQQGAPRGVRQRLLNQRAPQDDDARLMDIDFDANDNMEID